MRAGKGSHYDDWEDRAGEALASAVSTILAGIRQHTSEETTFLPLTLNVYLFRSFGRVLKGPDKSTDSIEV